MGLDITTVKPIKLVGEDEFPYKGHHYYIHQKEQNEWFLPLVHVRLYRDGLYKIRNFGKHSLSMCYSTYGRFRDIICRMAISVSAKDVWDNVDKYIDSPFIYLIHFTDCDGCYDYVIAEKLLVDFKAFEDKAKQLMVGDDSYLYDYYKTYISMLEDCVKIKGIVVYH